LWDIQFDHDGKVKTGVSPRVVKLVPEGSGILINEESTTTLGSRDANTLNGVENNSTEISADTSVANVITASEDPDPEDAMEEYEDNIEATITAGGGGDTNQDTEEADHPNNDFCFTEADFIETRNAMNNVMRHQGTHTTTWTAINALKGEVVETRNAEYGNYIWTVIEECNEDIFEEVREKEEALYQTKNFYNIIDNNNVKDEDYNKLFTFLWPETGDKDLEKLNGIVDNDNIRRKEEYKRTIKKVSKPNFLYFML